MLFDYSKHEKDVKKGLEGVNIALQKFEPQWQKLLQKWCLEDLQKLSDLSYAKITFLLGFRSYAETIHVECVWRRLFGEDMQNVN